MTVGDQPTEDYILLPHQVHLLQALFLDGRQKGDELVGGFEDRGLPEVLALPYLELADGLALVEVALLSLGCVDHRKEQRQDRSCHKHVPRPYALPLHKLYLIDENTDENQVVLACELILNVLVGGIAVLVEGEEGEVAEEVVLPL